MIGFGCPLDETAKACSSHFCSQCFFLHIVLPPSDRSEKADRDEGWTVGLWRKFIFMALYFNGQQAVPWSTSERSPEIVGSNNTWLMAYVFKEPHGISQNINQHKMPCYHINQI